MSGVDHALDRRRFLRGSLAASTMLMASKSAWSNQAASNKPKICAFIKYVQSYGYEELAEKIAAAGFDGVEATVRKDGYIEPKDAEQELPKLASAMRKRDLDVTIVCTDVLRADQPHAESVLRTTSQLGIKQYRLGFYRYDLDRPVLAQLDALRPAVAELAALNRELGLRAVFQNHSGPDYVGAPIWDIHRLIETVPVGDMAMAFDICHATIEGGLCWPIQYNLMRPRIGAVFVKDFDWVGDTAELVPLGKGRVDPTFFKMLQQDNYAGPYSLHVEYLDNGTADENMHALKRDLATLRKWLSHDGMR